MAPEPSSPGRLCRSLLFVPGNRPERFSKALASGADVVCIDWEDAVPPGSAKEECRKHTLAKCRETAPAGPPRLLIRINSLRTPLGLADLLALREASVPMPAIMLSKVEAPAEIDIAVAVLRRPADPRPVVWPLIETVAGLHASAAIARAAAGSPGAGVLLGGADLSAELGCAGDWESLLMARSRIIEAARLAGIDALDSPLLTVGDATALEQEALRSARLGFAGKAAIHPAQIGVIHRAFTPAPEALARARRIVAAYESMQGGVALLGGEVVERPVYLAALRIVSAGEAAGS